MPEPEVPPPGSRGPEPATPQDGPPERGAGSPDPGVRGANGGKGSAGSSWAPLRLPTFRSLWLAQLGSNVGTWNGL